IAWAGTMFSAAVALTEKSRKLAVTALCAVTFAVVAWGVYTAHTRTLPWWLVIAVIGVVAIAVGRPRGPNAMLILSGAFFGTAHVPPFGPLGMLCFLAAVVWLSFQPAAREDGVVVAGAMPR